MAKSRRNNRDTVFKIILVTLLVAVTSLLVAREALKPRQNLMTEDGFCVRFFDVGEADSALVTYNGEALLIDAGNNDEGEYLVNELDSLGIGRIKYAVGTHPHEDHIGAMDDIINSYRVDTLLLPDVQSDSYVLGSVLKAARTNGTEIVYPEEGFSFSLAGAKCTVLSCSYVTDPAEFNEWSIVLKIEAEGRKFLFTGDMTADNEHYLLQNGTDVSADVLKAAHHGSSDANTEEFLEKVSPEIIVVSAGENNEFFHPHPSVMHRFSSMTGNVYVTRDCGTVTVCCCDGSISVTTGKQ